MILYFLKIIKKIVKKVEIDNFPNMDNISMKKSDEPHKLNTSECATMYKLILYINNSMKHFHQL